MHVPRKLHERYAAPNAPLQPTTLTSYETDWDVIYPVSSFLETWRFGVAPPAAEKQFEWPQMGWEVKEKALSDGQRSLSFKLNFVRRTVRSFRPL